MEMSWDDENKKRLLSTNQGPIDSESGLETDDYKRQGPDSDPYETIIYSDCVNDKRSVMGNFLGWFDYHDRLYSRKFSTMDNSICNLLFGFFAWIFNRKQCFL